MICSPAWSPEVLSVYAVGMLFSSIATKGLDKQAIEEGSSPYQEGMPELKQWPKKLFLGDVIIYGFLSFTAAQ